MAPWKYFFISLFGLSERYILNLQTLIETPSSQYDQNKIGPFSQFSSKISIFHRSRNDQSNRSKLHQNKDPRKKMIKTTLKYTTEDHFTPNNFERGVGQFCHFYFFKFLKKRKVAYFKSKISVTKV